jgi:hypothetical protein
MQQTDYLLKQLEQLSKALTKLLSILLHKPDIQNKEQILFGVNQGLAANLGFQLDDMLKMSDEELLQKLKMGEIISAEGMEVLTDLIAESAVYFEEEERKVLLEKAILLLNEIDRHQQSFSLSRESKRQLLLNTIQKQ